MPRYLLLLHEDPATIADLSAAEIQRIVEQYRAWSRDVAQAGKLVGSAKLRAEGGRHVHARDGRVLFTDGPYAEAKEIIGGYFMIEAADYDEACAMAGGCPHAARGWIEVREVDPV